MAEQATNNSKSTKKKSKVVIIVISIIVILAIIISLIVYFLSRPKNKANNSIYPDILSEDKYTLKEPEYELDERHGFVLPLNSGVDLSKEYGNEGDVPSSSVGVVTTVVQGAENDGYKAVYGAARVFADASLTQEVPTSVYQINDEDGNRIEVEPNSPSCSDTSYNSIDIFHQKNADYTEFAFGRWYGYGGYYLVRYVGEDGSKLEKPEVTYFTVENDVNSEENKLASPENVECYVTEKGTLKLNWSPVEGADHYEVYLQAINPNTDSNERYTYTRLASTKDTSFDSITIDEEQDKRINESMIGEYDTYSQNYAFDKLVIGQNEDQILDNRKDLQQNKLTDATLTQTLLSDYVPNEEHVKKTSVTVIAVGSGKDQQSPFKFQSINELLNQMPLNKSNYKGEVNFKDIDPTQDPVGYMKARLYYYMVMADGTIASQQYKLDFSQVKTEQSNITHGPDEQHLVTEKMNEYLVPYTVENTNLSGNMDFLEMDWPGGVSQIEQVTNQALEELQKSAPKSGTLQRVDVNNDGIDWNSIQEAVKNIKPTKIKPEEAPYTVYGSTDYVKYIAANMVAGSTYIDITDYYTQVGAPDIVDVYNEAISQNPITLYAIGIMNPAVQKKDNNYYLVLNLTPFANTNGFDLNNLVEKRKQINEKADQIVASIIKDGMTDTQKAKTINDYLCNNFSYAHTELTGFTYTVGAYTALGLDGDSIVCSGYSQIFKLLADKAGLNSIVATGIVPKRPGLANNHHAWNLVNIDGNWKALDVTWNDKDDGSNSQSSDKYFLKDQTDEIFLDHTYDKDGLLDAVVTQYIDSSRLVS